MNNRLPIREAFRAAYAHGLRHYLLIVSALLVMGLTVVGLAIVPVSLIMTGIYGAKAYGLATFFGAAGSLLAVVALFAIIFLLNGLGLGWSKFILDIIDGKKPRIATLFHYFSKGGRLMLAEALIFLPLVLVIKAGIILILFNKEALNQVIQANPPYGGMIVAGPALAALLVGVFVTVIISIRLFFISYLIVDQDKGAVSTISASYHLTKGHMLRLFFVMLLSMVVGMVLNKGLGLLLGGLINDKILGYLGTAINVLVFTPFFSLVYAYLYRFLTNNKN